MHQAAEIAERGRPQARASGRTCVRWVCGDGIAPPRARTRPASPPNPNIRRGRRRGWGHRGPGVGIGKGVGGGQHFTKRPMPLRKKFAVLSRTRSSVMPGMLARQSPSMELMTSTQNGKLMNSAREMLLNFVPSSPRSSDLSLGFQPRARGSGSGRSSMSKRPSTRPSNHENSPSCGPR